MSGEGAPDASGARCPLCGGGRHARSWLPGQTWRGRAYANLDCRACGATFLHPSPGDAELAAIYARDAYHDVFYAEEEGADHARSIEVLWAHAPEGARVLDFGCGAGSFLAAARAAGFEATGVEVDAATIRMAREASGCEAATLEEIERRGLNFQVIHLGDVLEHLPDPEGIMRRLSARLVDGGCFMVEGPLENNPSPVYGAVLAFAALKRALDRGQPFEAPPTHLWRANAPGQRAFFERRLGLRTQFWEVYESGWPYLSNPPGRPPGARLKQLIGRLAVGLGGRRLGSGAVFGNRFIGLFAPEAAAAPDTGRL